jgi:ABC-type antimicrobial peptide transport system permease subunit
MEDRMQSVIPRRGYFVFAITAFAIAATLLAAIGIYGVMAYTVAQRTREIGIRVALGAAGHEVVGLVGRRTFLAVGLGLLSGMAGALAATQLIQSQLWDVTPTDPATFALVPLFFALVAIIAAFFPCGERSPSMRLSHSAASSAAGASCRRCRSNSCG